MTSATALPTLSISVEVEDNKVVTKRFYKTILMPDEGEDMAEEKKSPIEYESFSAGITVPTNVRFMMIRFDITGRAKNRKTFLKYAAPHIKESIEEIAASLGVSTVWES